MRFSIVVPAYNAERFLPDTLASLAAQSFSDFEVIVVDDGSTDSTLFIAEQYCEKFSFMKTETQVNSGVSAARNAGLKTARGDYIVFLDSDDLLSKNTLAELDKALNKNDADILLFRLVFFGSVKTREHSAAAKLAAKKNIDRFNSLLLYNSLVGNKCYRRSFLLENKLVFPPLKYSEEAAFFMQAVFKNAKISGCDKGIMHYRRHEKNGSVSVSTGKELVESFAAAFEIIFNGAKQVGAREKYLQHILFRADSILISQFYRLLWSADDETMATVKTAHEFYFESMNRRTKKKVKKSCPDLPKNLPFEKKTISKNPLVSIAIPEPDERILASVFEQSMPLFEVLIPAGSAVPVYENVKMLPAENFAEQAEKEAAKKIFFCLKSKEALDPRLLKSVMRLKLPKKIKQIASRPLFRFSSWILKKI